MSLFQVVPDHSQVNKQEIILSIRDLSVEYQTRRGVLSAIDTLSLDLYKGEVLGLVGESGSGKSTLGKAIMRMIPSPGRITKGQLIFKNQDLMAYDENQMRDVRGKQISMIFQDPMTSLNPVQRIDNHIIEAIRVHEPNISKDEALSRSESLMERLGIGRRRLKEYPHQLSGGMRQRVMIGLALALKANIIIADEATTSLDVIVEAQFLDLLRELKDEFGLTILLVTHNIGIVAELADRVAVMYAGRLAEVANVDELFHNPKHPYTQGLLRSVPNIAMDSQDLYRMDGTPPNLVMPPSGCRFHPRCPHVMDICHQKQPWLVRVDEIGEGDEQVGGYDKHLASCWLHQEYQGATQARRY
ncbi:MAG: ABC transporter ATP-binding protein [Chloroflexi bacterium]|nr:ABC transporter ATP-binding protein [Anaerolineae bacterium]MCQ3929688.1 ABC transporter ATP-binding protein [Chloroflexota bacterium]